MGLKKRRWLFDPRFKDVITEPSEGPWSYDGQGVVLGYEGTIEAKHGRKTPVCRLELTNIHLKSNARLIVHAPDLLRALKAVNERWRTWADYYAQTDLWSDDDERAFDLMDKAIQQAEGEKP